MSLGLDGKKRKYSIGFSFAWNGLVSVAKKERNFRIHLLVIIMVIITGILCRLSTIEWSLIIIVIGFVLVTEMLNTVIENTIDYLNPTIHPLAKNIKDISAAAVLVAAITAIIVGIVIFLPKLIAWIN
ncbi:diacylglycerol kinase family protein [Virgibacillus byunsanensis]|uniref:Diacylglycerol kinase family protein n=1 Tax=Virgibacillus byunsanensis TaxID=570945 RepID=A0ABW3LNM2_9BACI